MTKLHRCLSLAFVAAISFGSIGLGGCQLYFGNDDHHGGGWDPPDGGGGPGYQCDTNAQCAAGCYCQSGVCEEAGFCGRDQDCPAGYHCDDRSSCVPNPTCEVDGDCLAGSVCTDGHCETTCVCETDQDAVNQGYHHCDEARSTCENASVTGSCVGTIAATCTNGAPRCAQGSVPLIADGCWVDADGDGQYDCSAIAACDIAPTCSAFQYAADCAAGTACTIVQKGINCTMPGGGACQDGQAGCVCAQYIFDSCR